MQMCVRVAARLTKSLESTFFENKFFTQQALAVEANSAASLNCTFSKFFLAP